MPESDPWLDLCQAVEDALPDGSDAQFTRHRQFTDEMVRTLGEPVLVTDPADGITRPTWELVVPFDRLAAMCEEHNRRLAEQRRNLPRRRRTA